ncbi:DUF7827 domain-containing protein [Halostella salina]|uniref:DUF7827 domain-containing protein n=1 Tax=Halostella salina TaxID=1547897 RepID=UPI000EF839F7|nr:BGTF surface domain-containing protein [Halostella salina]
MTGNSHRAAGIAVAALLALAAVAGPGVTTADGGVPDASFGNSVVTEQRGDVAVVTVFLQDTDTATLTVGSQEVNYETRVRVRDGDGDGQVRVRINLHLANGWTGASANEVYSTVDGSDSVDATRQTGALDSPLDAGNYEMELSIDGSPTDVAALELESRSTGSVDTFVGAADIDPGDRQAVVEGVAQRDAVARGDLALVAIQASGVSGYIRNAGDLEGTQGVSLRIEQSNAGANQNPKRIAVGDGVLHTFPESDLLLLAVDTAEAGVESGEEYTAEFVVSSDNPYTDTTQTASTTFRIRDRTASFSDTPIRVDPDTAQTVRGTASVAPGTELTLRFESQNDLDPFIKDPTVTVGADGSFSTAVDFSGNEAGTEFTAVVVEGDTQISGTADGVIEGDSRTATTTPTPATTTRTPTTTRPATTTTRVETTTAVPTTRFETTTTTRVTYTAVTERATTTRWPTATLSEQGFTSVDTTTTWSATGSAGGINGSGNASFAPGGQPGFTGLLAGAALLLVLALSRRGE